MARELPPQGDPLWLTDEELKFQIFQEVLINSRVGKTLDDVVDQSKTVYDFVKRYGQPRAKVEKLNVIKKNEPGPFRKEPKKDPLPPT